MKLLKNPVEHDIIMKLSLKKYIYDMTIRTSNTIMYIKKSKYLKNPSVEILENRIVLTKKTRDPSSPSICEDKKVILTNQKN